ncbi:MAG TPA: LpqB family beta-propeller domain-containing protein [Pyrinomonadaceae bacterium]|nr:LpqB family beta-propeller domain-containing protein [Pyrinomonadaceae bacterium]
MSRVLSLFSGLLLCLCILPTMAAGQTRGEIAFIGAGTGATDIYLTATDNSSLVNITRGRLSGISAFAWSPDGSQLVVSADRGSNLYIVSADGSTLRALTHNTGFAITQAPSWSPDGTKIAYVGNAEQNYDVFLINQDGSGVSRLTNTRGIYRDLAWSPDGSRIAYASGADFFNVHIFVMRADGTAPMQVSTGGGSDTAPAWSPDGSHIAYQNDFQFGPPEVFTVKADGTGQTRLTNNFASDRHPTWSPDGTRIAFTSNRDSIGAGGQNYAIYIAGVDGSNPQRLTDQSSSPQAPAWRPANNPTPPAGAPFLLTEQGTGRAVALDSVALMRDPLPVYTDKNFSSDRHTRVLLFVGNLDPAAALETKSPVEVRFTDAQQRVYALRPEGAWATPGLAGVTQLTVRLPDELAAGGDVQVSITAGGAASNSAPLRIEPSPAAP